MPKEHMKRNAADNEYLHKDFHGALSAGIEYLHRNYGEQSVREYLQQFARSFYSPLRSGLKQRGLAVLKDHFEKMYRTEGGKIQITFSEDEMIMDVETCPAVMHMRGQGYPVAELFYETTKTVNEAICEGSDFAAELVEYDSQTGHSVQKFYRRQT